MFKETKIPCTSVQSLAWSDDHLIDWIGGRCRYYLDGSKSASGYYYAYSFDACAVSPSGNYAAIYKRLETKGLICRQEQLIREINRSFYQSEAYEYPVCLFTGPNNRELIAHCPENYNQLEIHDLETGECLTKADRQPTDFFHSRLSASPSGRYLLDCGWVWHPWSVGLVFDLHQALEDPTHLDGVQSDIATDAELSTAVFRTDDEIIASTNDEDKIYGLGVWNRPTRTWTTLHEKTEPLGNLMPLGDHFVVSFYNHPKLFDLRNGELVHEWPHLRSGKQNCSIIRGLDPLPPLALDPANGRFALVQDEHIHVIEPLPSL